MDIPRERVRFQAEILKINLLISLLEEHRAEFWDALPGGEFVTLLNKLKERREFFSGQYQRHSS